MNLNLDSLRSRKIRTSITNSRSNALAKALKPGGLLGKIFGFLAGSARGLGKLVGWGIGQLGRLWNWSISGAWSVIVDTYFALKNFNWNAMDTEIQEQIDRNNQQLLNAVGEAAGELVGFAIVETVNIVSGRALGAKAAKAGARFVVPKLSGQIASRLAEERNDTLVQNTRILLNRLTRTVITNSFLSLLLTARKERWFGLSSVTKQAENGSIQTKIDNQIQRLPKLWQQPVENFIEGIEEAIIEAGFVVANELDDAIAIARNARRGNGTYRSVEVASTSNPDEKYFFEAPQEVAIGTIATTLYGVVPTLQNKDVGEIFAQPIEEQVGLAPQLRKLTLTYRSRSKPPYTIKGNVATIAEISIPDVRRGLSYAQIRNTIPRFTRGDWFCKLPMANGRQMGGWFVTAGEGEKVLNALATLSSVAALPIEFRASQGKNASTTDKKVELMYVSKAALLYPRRTGGKNLGRLGTSQWFNCWNPKPPADLKPML